MKRLTALILAGIMLFALCACTGSTGKISGEVSYDIPEGKAVPDDAVINVTIASHASWPYQDDWAVWKYIREGIGGTINVNAVPATDFATKFPLIMASKDGMPDVFGFQGRPVGFADYCEQGAFVALDDYPELVKDYNDFWDSLPEDQQEYRNVRKSPVDGKIYFAPIYGTERSTNVRAWLYRKDIFEKHNLEVPTTTEELYQVSKKLKELYPDSYPFSMRAGMQNLGVIGSTWKPNFRPRAYYDFENEKWSYGATEDTMLEMITFLKKMYDEKLIPADFFNINATTWQELVTTNRGFIMPEYQVRIDFFNNLARPTNPEFTMAVMTPPHADNGVGISMLNKWNYDPMGFAVCNTGDEGRVANAMRYVNWFYSDEGSDAVSWGKEGETYEVVDGEKKFIIGEGETMEVIYGFQTIGSYLRLDPEAVDASQSKEISDVTDFILENTYPKLDPTVYLEFSPEDAKILADYDTSIKTHVEENIQKFVIGQRPLTEWDEFQAELSELPIDDLLALYETAYNKVK